MEEDFAHKCLSKELQTICKAIARSWRVIYGARFQKVAKALQLLPQFSPTGDSYTSGESLAAQITQTS